MPTKRNSAGQQQNYVPAGNGDASGEYGNNESGSNKNWSNPEKNSETSGKGLGVEITQGSGEISYKGKDYKDQQEITNIIMQKMGVSRASENVDRVVAQLNAKNINPQIRNVVLSTLESGNYTIKARKNGAGVYYAWGKEISFSSTDQMGRATGETMFHEVGHALDHQYDNGRGLWSRDYKSKEFGKTMLEMKQEELKQALSNGGYKKLVDAYSKEATPNPEKYNKLLADIRETNESIKELEKLPTHLQNQVDQLEQRKKEALDMLYTDKIRFFEFSNIRKECNEKIDNIQQSYENPNIQKLNELRNRVSELNKQKSDLTNNTFYNAVAKYSDISDMCEAMGYRAFAGGHGSSYWDTGHKATECFAEIQSAMGTNKASLEVLQKYIPNTIKIYKEIIGVIHNGK